MSQKASRRRSAHGSVSGRRSSIATTSTFSLGGGAPEPPESSEPEPEPELDAEEAAPDGEEPLVALSSSSAPSSGGAQRRTIAEASRHVQPGRVERARWLSVLMVHRKPAAGSPAVALDLRPAEAQIRGRGEREPAQRALQRFSLDDVGAALRPLTVRASCKVKELRCRGSGKPSHGTAERVRERCFALLPRSGLLLRGRGSGRHRGAAPGETSAGGGVGRGKA
eukprot:COSAG04_NODE_4051_length_2338_cov_1.289862_2_plen_224_part_00